MGTRQSLYKRTGSLTVAEKNLVAAVALDQPGEMKPAQVNALATALRRSKDAVRSMIEDAKAQFQGNAGRYVEIHKAATEAALVQGSVAGLEVAQKGAQWALERVSGEGTRVIDKAAAESGPVGPRVMIGIKVGGTDTNKAAAVDVTAVEVP